MKLTCFVDLYGELLIPDIFQDSFQMISKFPAKDSTIFVTRQAQWDIVLIFLVHVLIEKQRTHMLVLGPQGVGKVRQSSDKFFFDMR